MMVVSLRDAEGPRFGRPAQLFQDPYRRSSNISPDAHPYDMTDDGSRLVMIQHADQTALKPDLRVVIGWLDSLDLNCLDHCLPARPARAEDGR
jgi:hypothetical protein